MEMERKKLMRHVTMEHMEVVSQIVLVQMLAIRVLEEVRLLHLFVYASQDIQDHHVLLIVVTDW